MLSEAGLTAIFGDALQRTIGPAYHGWLDPARFRPAMSSQVRGIESGDASAIQGFRSACSEGEWDDGGLELDAPGGFGWFEGNDLLAAASLTHWDETTVGPGVLVRPGRRRAGCGTAVCSAAVEWALGANLTLTYQTLLTNTGAIGIAGRLGFEQYASHVAVRLARAA